jgi:hypothetical protein
MPCCQRPAPDKGNPGPRSRSNDDGTGVAKVLSHYLLAIVACDTTAGSQSGKSPYALSANGNSFSLQLQHVRLQI